MIVKKQKTKIIAISVFLETPKDNNIINIAINGSSTNSKAETKSYLNVENCGLEYAP
ncbi:MAG: hypothetical protein WCQ47_02095 [bacterium]